MSYLAVVLLCTVGCRLSWASFMVTSTMSSSPSTDFATTLPSPEESMSEAFVTDISGSVFSDVSESSARLNSGQFVKVATFSRTLRLIASSSRALYNCKPKFDSARFQNTYLFWSQHNEMRRRNCRLIVASTTPEAR